MANSSGKLDKFLKKRIKGRVIINHAWDVYEALLSPSNLSDREIENQ